MKYADFKLRQAAIFSIRHPNHRPRDASRYYEKWFRLEDRMLVTCHVIDDALIGHRSRGWRRK